MRSSTGIRSVKSRLLSMARHSVVLTRKDADAFSERLREAFPAIRFFFSDYTEPWIDQQASRERRNMKNQGLLPADIPSLVMRHPGDEPLRYLPSLGDAVQAATVWVEPRGWKPRWSPAPNREGVYTIINRPKLQFQFTRSRYVFWRQPLAFDEPPAHIPDNEILVLDGDAIYGYFRRDDKEHQSFLRKVWRILDKCTTTERAYCDHTTLEPLGITRTRSVWAGFDAVEWARRDSRHFIRGGGTFYRPAECFRTRTIGIDEGQ